MSRSTDRPAVSSGEPARPAASERRVFVRTAAMLAIAGLVLIGITSEGLTSLFFRRQDALVIVLAVLIIAGLGARMPAARLRWPEPSWRLVGAAALFLFVLVAIGTQWIMFDYRLERDSRMVEFDMGIFAEGRLAEVMSPAWQSFALALVPDFLLDVPNHAALVSTYLPVNAAVRAAFAALGAAPLLNPLFTAVGIAALADIARREFPHHRGAVWVSLLTYALSAQVLATGMTAYAMTQHLAYNLVWLALFLRGKPWQHAAALPIGFAAIGLHQAVFHPLFVAPFLLALLPQRRWKLFALYAAFYVAAVLFWFSYPSLVVASVGVVAEQGSAAGLDHFASDRIAPLFAQRVNVTRLMAYNLLRFAAWMPLFLLPMLAFAWPAVRERRGLAAPALGGIVLLIAAMAVILPAQGHGWGYRYLHGFLGNAALLAGWGYAEWSARRPRHADGAFAVLAVATALLTVPFLLWSAHRFVEPYVHVSRFLERQRAPFVVVDTDSGRTVIDQVSNRADLANRPLLFASHAMSEQQIDTLCARGRITFVGPAGFAGIEHAAPGEPQPNPRFSRLVARAGRLGCRVPAN